MLARIQACIQFSAVDSIKPKCKNTTTIVSKTYTKFFQASNDFQTLSWHSPDVNDLPDLQIYLLKAWAQLYSMTQPHENGAWGNARRSHLC